MTKKIYNKLIRDRIPEIIAQDGSHAVTRILDSQEFQVALKQKLIEEAQELLEAENKDDVLNELSDVSELFHAIAENAGIPLPEIEKKRLHKKEDRGGFQKKLFLEYVEEKE